VHTSAVEEAQVSLRPIEVLLFMRHAFSADVHSPARGWFMRLAPRLHAICEQHSLPCPKLTSLVGGTFMLRSSDAFAAVMGTSDRDLEGDLPSFLG
jgi:hypothetical protein